jgi:drug/metabolite transporter (DMT)-like permease
MPNEVFIAILCAAAMNAAWNTAVKVGGDKLTVMAVTTLVGSLISLPALAFIQMPGESSWALLGLSIAIHTVYHLVLPMAYRHGDLGQVYPMARGAAPLLVTVAAAVLLGELPPAHGLIGVAFISCGVLALAVRRRSGQQGASRAVIYALATGGLIAAYTVVDAMGARLSGSVLGFAVVLTIGDGIATALIVLAWKGARAFRIDARTLGLCSFAGAMQIGAYWIAVWALSQAPMGIVSALRESSVLFIGLIAKFLLNEQFGKQRAISSLLIFTGIVSVRLGM